MFFARMMINLIKDVSNIILKYFNFIYFFLILFKPFSFKYWTYDFNAFSKNKSVIIYAYYQNHIAFITRKITRNHINTIGMAKYQFLGLPSFHNPSASIRHSSNILGGINRTVIAISPGSIIISSK